MLDSITPVPDIAPILHRLNLIADRCTQMTPAARYQSVAELKMPYRSHIILRSTALLLPVIQVHMHTITMIMQTIQPMPILLNELSTTVLPVSSHPDFARELHGNAAILSRISVHNMALPVTGIRKYLRSKAVA